MRHLPRIRRLAAGVVDSGTAAVASFVVGVYATRTLGEVGLGVYGLFFSAFLLATMIPTGLVFTPALPQALILPHSERIRVFHQTLRLGAVPALLGSVLTALALIPAWTDAGADLLMPMAVTAFAAAFVSPMQDHVRNLLHLGRSSPAAALVSVVQLTVTVGVVYVADSSALPAPWIPFGALTIANISSLSTGIAYGVLTGDRPARRALDSRSILDSGRWFLIGQAIPRLGDFVSRSVIVLLAGADVLGFAEGARIAARPLLVFLIGISTVLNPRGMEAGKARDWRLGRRLTRWATIGVWVSALAYLAVAGISWEFNPIKRLVPLAYVIGGLVPITVLANAAKGSLFIERAQLVGAGQERRLANIEMAAAVAQVAAAFTALAIGPFAFAAGLIAVTGVRWLGYRSALKELGGHSESDDRSDRDGM